VSNIIPFVPKKSVQGQKALDALVEHYKKVMEKPLDNPVMHRQSPWEWGNFKWEGLGRFMKHEYASRLGSTSKTLPLEMALHEKTLHELQALIMHGIACNLGKSRASVVGALRALLLLEEVLRKRSKHGIADFSDVKASDLDDAGYLSMQSGKKDSTRSIPLMPAKRLLVNAQITQSSSVKNWVDSLRASQDSDYRVSALSLGGESDEKLPDMQAVQVTAEYFANQPWLTRGEDTGEFDEDQRNIVVSSGLAILSLTPCRIEELVKNLSVFSLVRQPESRVGEVLGISWYADKTDMDNTKWVPYTASGEFEAVVEEAFARLKYVSEGARALCRRWDSECPEYDEAEYLKAKREGRLPKGWPYFEPKLKLRYSDALFIHFKHQMHPISKTVKDQIAWVSRGNFKDWLRTRPMKNQWTGEPITSKGFFDRIGHAGLNLVPDDYNSHSFRHMVNTAARLGGMSEFDVNMWSHRKKAGQGEVYNHTTGEQRRNLIVHGSHKAKELAPEERLEQIRHGVPMTRANLGIRFDIIGNSHGGFTFQHPLGNCIHNYLEGPCERDMDCALCPENANCKGDKRSLKNLKEELNKSNHFLEMAIKHKDPMAEDRFTRRSEVLIALVDVLGDKSPLADGDIVVLSPDQVPKVGLQERAKLAAEQIKKNQAEIEDRHGEAKAKIGVSRSLPKLDEKPKDCEEQLHQDIDLLMDDFLNDFDDDED
jgi:hypothetical protein